MIKGIVIAGNYPQYTLWINDNKKNVNEYIFVKNKRQLMGLRNVEVIKTGTYLENPVNDSLELTLVNRVIDAQKGE